MRIVHLYPFVPRGRHGGTLRLLAAVGASARVGEPSVFYFDRDANEWRGPVDPTALAALVAEPPRDEPPPVSSLKRRLLPSTLWESGRRPRRALPSSLLGEGALVLHTTYLAPALAAASARVRAVVDAYDLVWRAQSNDAAYAGAFHRGLRRAYAATVRRREEAALAGAARVIAAGADDFRALATKLPRVSWIPTPAPVAAVPPPDPAGRLRLGILGNFAHVSTRHSLDRLLASELSRAPAVSIVVAGLHADNAVSLRDNVTVLGPVDRVEDFYEVVDCVVAPVVGGSGMKVKLAEAILAGRPVITTALGAAGYPPELGEHFALCEPRDLAIAAVRQAIDGFDVSAARLAFERALGPDAVAGSYEAALREAFEE